MKIEEEMTLFNGRKTDDAELLKKAESLGHSNSKGKVTFGDGVGSKEVDDHDLWSDHDEDTKQLMTIKKNSTTI
jgi:hypothetical protein